MDIFIDEAGTFALNGAEQRSWCVVAAYITPETERKQYTAILRRLKITYKKSVTDEIKLKDIQESDYFRLLQELSALKGILLCVATDSYTNKESEVQDHKKNLVRKILENEDKMIHESGKKGIRHVAEQIEMLSPQLYIQLRCQVRLMHAFVERGIPYFVQKYPNSLKTFRWRIDQKQPAKKTNYEETFEKLSPVLLQAQSIENPIPFLDWCDYRPMQKFLLTKGNLPKYIVDAYPHLTNEFGFDIGKITREDIKFVESKSSSGVQIADLLASGLKRCLRSEFSNNVFAAVLLGKIMISEKKNGSPINIASIVDNSLVDEQAAEVIHTMIKSCRPLIPPNK